MRLRGILRAPVARITRRVRPACHLVVGNTPESRLLAINLRARGESVAMVGAPLTGPDADALARRGVRLLPHLDERRLTAWVRRAPTVTVCAEHDRATVRLGERVMRAAGTAPLPTLALFDESGAAREWQDRCSGVAITRTEAHVLAALHASPPRLGTHATPPPLVIGGGSTAAELVRRIATGWQQFGEPTTIHLITSDESWANTLRHELGPHGTDLAHLTLDHLAPLTPADVAGAVDGRISAWRPPPARHGTPTGPTIYVVGDAGLALSLARHLAEGFPQARVAALSTTDPIRRPEPAFTLVDRHRVLGDPSLLSATPQRRAADEILREAASWPQDVPSVFGQVACHATDATRPLPWDQQPPEVRSAVASLAARADDLLRGIDVTVTDDGPSEQVLLSPDDLRALRDALVQAVPAPAGLNPVEHRQRALEFAAVLPVVLARAGRRLRRPPHHRDALTRAQIEELAEQVHRTYLESARALGDATRSEIAHQTWAQVDDFTRTSNRAQVADVAAKLVSVGLTWRRVPSPTLYPLSDDRIDRLARLEHRRWQQFERRNGRADHRLAVPWRALDERTRQYNRNAVLALPAILATVGLEIIDPVSPRDPGPPAS